MIEELKILNGSLSLEFDNLNSRYTVYLPIEENKIEFTYTLKEGASAIIYSNENLKNNSEVIFHVSEGENSQDYLFAVYKEESNAVISNIDSATSLEVPKELESYVAPSIASICFLLILFLFSYLFHRRSQK